VRLTTRDFWLWIAAYLVSVLSLLSLWLGLNLLVERLFE